MRRTGYRSRPLPAAAAPFFSVTAGASSSSRYSRRIRTSAQGVPSSPAEGAQAVSVTNTKRPLTAEIQMLDRLLPHGALRRQGQGPFCRFQLGAAVGAVQIRNAGYRLLTRDTQQQPKLRRDGESAALLGPQQTRLAADQLHPGGNIPLLTAGRAVHDLGRRAQRRCMYAASAAGSDTGHRGSVRPLPAAWCPPADRR